MEVLPIVLTTVLVILAVVMVVVGVQVIFVLFEVRKTLHRVNQTIDLVENRVNTVLQPFQSLGGMAGGLQTGLKVFETFVSWLGRSHKEDNR